MHILSDARVLDRGRLTEREAVVLAIEAILDEVGVQRLATTWHDFEGGGFTCVFLLAESHVALHTWPEELLLTLDVYLCNVLRDNGQRARCIHNAICDLFDVRSITTTNVDRR